MSTSSLTKEPLIIYRDILIPLMTASGFKFVHDSSDEKRYHTRFIWQSKYVDTDFLSEYYGQTRTNETNVDVVGIPMGSSFLILHGIVVGGLAEESDDVKLKIRCLPRSSSITISDSRSCNLYGSPDNSTTISTIETNNTEEYRKKIKNQLQTEFVYKLIEMFSLRIDELPSELKIKILSLLPLNSIIRMSLVSNQWREISLDDQLWKLMVRKFYPDIYSSRVKGQSWKALFKDEFRRGRVLQRRRHYAHNRDMMHSNILALPSSPPLLPIAPPPFYPMLPAPPSYMRELIPYHHAIVPFHKNREFPY